VARSIPDQLRRALLPNGYYHFHPFRKYQIRPVNNRGYTLLSHHKLVQLWRATYWFHPMFGARLEFRDHVYTPGLTINYWVFLVGLAFH
jgi:hypothetical protein